MFGDSMSVLGGLAICFVWVLVVFWEFDFLFMLFTALFAFAKGLLG